MYIEHLLGPVIEVKEGPVSFTPTDEQAAVMDAAGSGKTVVVTAGAGTGKTSTMRLAAGQMTGRGLYLAFNKAIATEAKASFPAHVDCRTAHSIAYQAIGKRYRGRLNGPRQPAREVARLLRINHPIDLGGRRFLQPTTIARLAVDAVAHFCRSVDTEPDWWHVEHLEGIDDEANRKVRQLIAPYARKIWDDLQLDDAAGGGQFRFQHDHYLKLWGRSEPRLPHDFIIFDEAQDADRIISSVVQAQDHAQTLVVGDANQAIYGWRGATDALSKWPADVRLKLSQSWRFGPAVAGEANKWLHVLRSDLRITGSGPASTIGEIKGWPDAILCRTNGTAVSQVMAAMADRKRVSLVGGGQQITNLAKACLELQGGKGTSHPELAVFRTWGEVQGYAREESDGSDLRTFVTLIDNHGAEEVIDAMNRLWRTEDTADVVVSTAHKAKGREWDRVRVANDFDEPVDAETGESKPIPREDAMLAYVTVTRAKKVLDRGGLAWIDGRPELARYTA